MAPRGANYPPSPLSPPNPFSSAAQVFCTENEWKTTTGLKCADAYCTRESDATKATSTVFSIPTFMSALLSPFLGGAVDRFGGRGLICLASALLLALVHALLGYTAVTPYVCMVLQGLAYSMFASAIWPSVPHLVPERSVGIAYGVVTAAQNAGLAAIPLCVSAIYEASDEAYIPNVELLFVLFAVRSHAAAADRSARARPPPRRVALCPLTAAACVGRQEAACARSCSIWWPRS